MAAKFDRYEERKGLWFWMMLSIGAVVSEEPDLTARKSDHIVQDFIESEFFESVFSENASKRYQIKRKFYG